MSNPNLNPNQFGRPFRKLSSEIDGWAGDVNGGFTMPTRKVPTQMAQFRPKDKHLPVKN